MTRVRREIEKFRKLVEQPRLGAYHCQKLCDDVLRLWPVKPERWLPSDKDTGLVFMAVTHGNEVGGIAVLNQLLQLIEQGLIHFKYPIIFALGNPAAALADKRFLERDLNRSFLRDSSGSAEDRRARELEKVLIRAAYFVDIHQTIEPSLTPFLIFPYQAASFDFGRQIAPDLPIVTHWGASFSKDGSCSDEFVNRHGGVGLTIELGQKGFSNYQEGIGLRVLLRAMMAVDQRLRGEEWPEPELPAEIYTWAEVLPFPAGEAGLDKGWYNFQRVEKGQRLGYCNGQEILASISGPILFPKYPASPDEPRPKEICRIMKSVTRDQLGKA